MPEYSTSIDIAAPPDVVFAHLVQPERMVAWMGQHATLDPTPGGTFAVDINGVEVRGEYVEVDPPRRVVVTWGMHDSLDLPPGTSRVEFVLAPTTTGTVLTLHHTGLPATHGAGHAAGWSHYLQRFERAARGLDPGRDTFVPPSVREPRR